MNKELLRDAVSVMETWGARFPDGMSASDRAVLTRIQAEIDAPEPYDQQALEPCEVCGWKTIMPGEPCLMCERNAKMLEPEKEPFGWYSAKNDEFMLHLRKTEHERLGSYTSKVGGFDAPLYTKPQYPVADLTDDEIRVVYKNLWPGGPHMLKEDFQFVRAVLAAQKVKR